MTPEENVQEPKKKKVRTPTGEDFVYRLLAFGALASGALNSDMQEAIVGKKLVAAATALRAEPSRLTETGKAYLRLLGFPNNFVDNLMPWHLINTAGLKAMNQIMEPDGDPYDDGMCFAAFRAGLAAVKNIKK